MGNTFYFDWELRLMELFQTADSPVVNAIAQFFSFISEELLLIVIIGFFYWSYDKETGKRVSMTFMTALSCGTLVKGAVMRRRPYMDNESVKCLRPAHSDGDIMDVSAQGYSFPSSHAGMSSSLYGSLAVCYINIVWKIIGVIIPLCVGLSRVYIGVHYPTDVLTGWLIGTAALGIISFLYKKIKNRTVIYCIITAATLPGLFYCRDSEYFNVLGIMIGFAASFIFEEKYVSFENTRSISASVLRVIGGVLVFFIVSTLIKLPFSAEFRESATAGAFALRSFRYAAAVFCAMGLFPILFGKVKLLRGETVSATPSDTVSVRKH
ncbi:MAG: phosphatase PAP2 family protein [Ruminococcus sp.]|nr:phosphatase PAP2 family protein [Ruminococcus sp.]